MGVDRSSAMSPSRVDPQRTTAGALRMRGAADELGSLIKPHLAALASLAAGAPVVLMQAFDAAALVRRHGLPHVFDTDDMPRRLLDLDAAAASMPSLRLLGGGMPVSPRAEVRARCRIGRAAAARGQRRARDPLGHGLCRLPRRPRGHRLGTAGRRLLPHRRHRPRA